MKRCIYIIGNSSGDIKIGIGKDPEKRIKTLQCGNSEKLELLYHKEVKHASKVESRLHTHYKESRLSGEWFCTNNIDIELVKEQIDEYEKMFNSLIKSDNPFV